MAITIILTVIITYVVILIVHTQLSKNLLLKFESTLLYILNDETLGEDDNLETKLDDCLQHCRNTKGLFSSVHYTTLRRISQIIKRDYIKK